MIFNHVSALCVFVQCPHPPDKKTNAVLTSKYHYIHNHSYVRAIQQNGVCRYLL